MTRAANASTVMAPSPRAAILFSSLLDSLLQDPYFRAKPPKTAGREQYGAAFVDRLVRVRAPIEDLIATATAFTAAAIAAGITQFRAGHRRSDRLRRRHAQPPAHGTNRRFPARLPRDHDRAVRHRPGRERGHRVRDSGASDMETRDGKSPRRHRRPQSRRARKNKFLNRLSRVHSRMAD